MRKLWAFLVRGYLIEASYPMSFLGEIVGSIVPIVVFYFASQLIDTSSSPALAPYGGKYFQFALVGLALTQYYNRALRMAAESLRRAQLSGVLEAILSTPTRPAAFVAYDAAFGIVAASTQLFFVLAIGGFTLGVDFSRTNVLGVVIAVALGLVSLTAFGILAAALTIVLKKGDPIQMVVGGASAIVSGAFFPVSLFPKPVRVLASLLPTTHALEGARLAFFAGAGFSRIGGSLGILLAMSLVLFPLSLWCFEVAVTMARRDGTLIQY